MDTGIGRAKRRKLAPQASKRQFTKHASRTHRLNMQAPAPMRGGIRL